MNNIPDSFFWHDGNVSALNYTTKNKITTLKIEAAFYAHDLASERSEYTLSCQDVTKFNHIVDFNEINDNSSAGSISNGYLKGNTLWLYLSDGIIEINAKEFNLKKH